MWEQVTRGFYLGHYLSPVGWLTLCANNIGLCQLSFGKFGTPNGSSIYLDTATAELARYFSCKQTTFSVPLHVNGTSFQKSVWRTLAEIPCGALPAYSDIAAKIGRPSATRAVGMAIHKNPIPIIIPCHRVIGKDGGLTGYVAGLDTKRYLLRLELGSSSTKIGVLPVIKTFSKSRPLFP